MLCVIKKTARTRPRKTYFTRRKRGSSQRRGPATYSREREGMGAGDVRLHISGEEQELERMEI